jgi:sugar O-acyltransferase (sialic acid O-acetyltransferase NeuD family)
MEYIPKNIIIKENSIAIIGCEEGNAGQIHSWIEKEKKYHVACFVNISEKLININKKIESKKRDSKLFNYPTTKKFKNIPLITTLNWLNILNKLNINKILITSNNKHERFEQILEAKKRGFKLINAIHPSVIINENCLLHENIILHSGVIIGYSTEIFDGVIVNTGSQIDHHNVIKNCVTIDPGVTTAGNVTINDFSQIHTGSILINKIKIGKNSIIGAGSVIIKDVEDNVTVVGVPGRIIKK